MKPLEQKAIMTTRRFNGKALYQPSGKAAEYSLWACNFYTGCSNDCEYCYCKRGVMSHVWSTNPKLKKCFKDEFHALDIFEKELKANLEELRRHGLLFSFTTDPMLPETIEMTLTAMGRAVLQDVPVKILTKRTDWFDTPMWVNTEPLLLRQRNKIAFGFTLTGFDEQEPWASTNDERIEVMRELHEMGFKTFASIEPVITPAMSRNMIEATLGFCDLYKVGLISGVKKDFYNRDHIIYFFGWLTGKTLTGTKIYLKDSFLKYLDIDREALRGNFVASDYNIFKPRKQMNGIIISGKVFEAVKEGDCQVCDFDRHCKQCMEYGELCHLWDSAFRYSEELTLKLNKR